MLERLGFQQLIEETLTVKRLTRAMSMSQLRFFFGRARLGFRPALPCFKPDAPPAWYASPGDS